MSSRSTVRCHHCWQLGHNVKTCTQLTKDVKADPGGYYHRKYSKHFDEQGNRVSAKKANKCSYCNNGGHTKRTCNVRIEDMVHNIKTNAKYRSDVYAWFVDNKLGIGSLVEIYNQLYLVTGIRWDDFICGSSEGYSLTIEPVTREGYCYSRYKMNDDEMSKGFRYSWQRYLKVEAGSDHIPKPSDEWFSGRTEWYTENFKGKVKNSLS